MSAARRMKLEGLLRLRRARARRQVQPQLTERDAAEVERFRRYLVDKARGLTLPQLLEVHGAAYLGFTEAEARTIAGEAAEHLRTIAGFERLATAQGIADECGAIADALDELADKLEAKGGAR